MKESKADRIYKVIMIIVLTVVITFIVTTLIMYNKIGDTSIKYITESSNMDTTFRTFHDFIEKNYIGDLDEDKMLENALKGYVEGLGDEYSEYIAKGEMEEYIEDTMGKYVGIGVYIANNTETNQIIVVMPIKGGSAEEAGIQAGDIITKINDVTYTGEQLSEASRVLKSEAGTIAKVEVLRNGDSMTFEVERREVTISHIESSVLDNRIGYMQIASFNEECYDEFKENYENLKNQNISSLIIDLRNNGGGIVSEALDIADMFTNKDDTLLVTTSKNEKEKVTKAKEDKKINMPIVILVNENTASASEILTAAIKENNVDNVTVVGTKTFGKGVIQTIFSLSDGSGLKLTTNEYFTPKHNKINKVGITPDVIIDLEDGTTYYTVTAENDTQLKKAIEILKNK